MSSLAQKVWFITGCSTGLGKAFASYAVGQGYKVVATARNPSTLDELVKSNPENVLALKLDVTVDKDIKSTVAAAVERFGRIDVLINNAGYSQSGPVEETSDEALRDQMNTNFFGAVAMCREVLPFMRAQKTGSIVQISSGLGSFALPGVGAYCASKFALECVSEAMHAEVAPFGIKVMIVKPGFFRTAILTPGGQGTKVTPRSKVYDKNSPSVQQQRMMAALYGQEPGDPDKAAIAIDLALKAEKTPLRLVLGNDAIDLILKRNGRQLQEYQKWDEVTRGTDFKDSVPHKAL